MHRYIYIFTYLYIDIFTYICIYINLSFSDRSTNLRGFPSDNVPFYSVDLDCSDFQTIISMDS